MREEVTILHTIGLDYAAIGRALGISAEDARALCQSLRERALRRHLTRRTLNTLLQGRPAYIGGKTISRRAKHLVEIASAYTPDKLLCEPRVGQVTVTEIQLWLEKRDASLRSPY